MDLSIIATLIYIGLLLIFGVISAAVVYHLRRYYLHNDTLQEIMGIAYFIVSGILISAATYFFLAIEWRLITTTFL